METTSIILQGGGEHARVVLDCLQHSNVSVIAIFDPKYSGTLMGVPQRGVYDPTFEPHAKAIVAIGDNALRKVVAAKTLHTLTTAIHSSALISKYATIGVGSMVLHAVVIQAQTTIGQHVILNTKCQVDHDCLLGDYVHVAPGAVLCGTVQVGEGALIGAASVVLPGKKIGKWAIVGAGSVVTTDVPDYAVVVGNPAKIIKYTNP